MRANDAERPRGRRNLALAVSMSLALFLLAAPGYAQQEGEKYILEELREVGDCCRIEEVERVEALFRSKGKKWGSRKEAYLDQATRRYTQVVEQYEPAGTWVFEREYEVSKRVKKEVDSSKKEKITSPAQGQAVRVEFKVPTLQLKVRGEERLLEQEDRDAVRRWLSMFPYLPREPVAEGDTWELDPAAVGYAFYGKAYNEQLCFVRGQAMLARVRERRGGRIAECVLELKVQNHRIAAFPALEIEAEGVLEWDIDGGRLLSLRLEGPLSMETSTYHDDEQIEITGEGTYSARIEVRWLEQEED